MSERAFNIMGMDISAFMCKDGARAIAWYRDVLGLEPALVYPDNRGAEYQLPDGTTFGLFGGGGAMPFQANNGILFAVDDLSSAVSSLKERGIPIVMERELANCSMAVINDSEGNSVFLHKRK